MTPPRLVDTAADGGGFARTDTYAAFAETPGQIRIAHLHPQLSRRERLLFCFQLEQMVDAGIPLVDALTELRDEAGSGRLRRVIYSVVAAIHGGSTFADALANQPGAFDETIVSLVHAGERSGTLPEILHKIVDTLQWEDELATQTRQLLAYPIFATIVVAGCIAFLFACLVPQMKSFVRDMGGTLPDASRTLFWIADLIAAYGPWLAGLPLIAASTVALAAKKSPSLSFHLDALGFCLPILGPLRRKLIVARLAGTLATLYGAGIPLTEAIDCLRRERGHRSVTADLYRVTESIANGHSLTRAFQSTALFPPLAAGMLAAGEKSGTLEPALRKIAYFYGRDARDGCARLQRMAGPLLTLLLGATVGWVALAVLGPIYDVITGIRP